MLYHLHGTQKVNIEALGDVICLSVICQSEVVFRKQKQVRGYRLRWKIPA